MNFLPALRKSAGDARDLPFEIPWWIGKPLLGVVIFLIFLTFGRIIVGFSRGVAEKIFETDRNPENATYVTIISRIFYTIVFLVAFYVAYLNTGLYASLITLGVIGIAAFVRSRSS